MRHYSRSDKFLQHVQQGLMTLARGYAAQHRVNPADACPAGGLLDAEQRHAAGLMRVNHAGEVCAQALYQGQALTARSAETREKMQSAADEEQDHLAWCQQRLSELDSHTSRLNPFWYFGALAIGISAGLIGDRWNLGFVAETEAQVVEHLRNHLGQLPAEDIKSRAIVSQMQMDEAEHRDMAKAQGAANLPQCIKTLMRLTSRVMTKVAYYV